MVEINCKKDEIEVLESLCKSSTYFAEEFGKYFELFKQNITNDFPITLNTDIVKLCDFQRKLIVSVLKMYQNYLENKNNGYEILFTDKQMEKNKKISNDISEIIRKLMY